MKLKEKLRPLLMYSEANENKGEIMQISEGDRHFLKMMITKKNYNQE